VCLSDEGVCGCTTDSQCGDGDSGRICNGSLCTAGCSHAEGRNRCPSTQYCSDQSGGVGTCRGQVCVDDDECRNLTPEQPICDTDPEPNECVQCLLDDHCSVPANLCDDRRCVECTSERLENCTATGKGAACLTSNTCGCVADGDCGSATSGRVCGANSLCRVGCRGTGGNGCPEPLVCSSTDTQIGTCVECRENSHCPQAMPVCDTVQNRCVECLTDEHCSNPTPSCNVSTGICEACSSDDDCTDPLLPACHVSGPLSGSCAQCSGINSTLCSGNDPICLVAIGECGCTDVDGDSECGASDSGRVCSGPEGSCIDGCSLAEGRNRCPSTHYCSEQTGGVGQCLKHCTTNADCPEPEVCDTSATPHVCVDCVLDTDCPAPLVCDEAQRKCVGCTDDTDCTPPMVCDTTRQICVGCSKDSDCPAPTVCNTATRTCVGCRTDTDCDGNLVCDPDNSECVECNKTADCENDLVCNPTNNQCTECTPSDTSKCSADRAGSACLLPDHICGCETDADCGDGSSRVCDTTTRVCVDAPRNVVQGGGCACSVPSGGSRPPLTLGWLALLLLLRRRRRSSP
jgi:MYXO-CTERM domain-containing protein